ncbi:MAG TPA: serine hydrolase domain-containing protein [Candidatus Polarisedimenticolaceae bacterium]|nr:serine hydrolase domain-containing protein [Candidatus Polarisedimenticolaceae bacterium]
MLRFAVALLAFGSVLAQQGPPPQVRAAIQSVEGMLEGTDDASLKSFADEHLSPAYRASFGPDALMAHLKSLRAAVGGQIGGLRVERAEDGLRLMIQGAKEATFALKLDDAGRVALLDLVPGEAKPPSPEAAIFEKTTWESLSSDLAKFADTGFSGVVLARRDGKEVLRSSYGLADRAGGRHTAGDTIYCIGSTPIDFTMTGILLLGQRGQLGLDDPVAKFIPGVPDDKKAMTIRQLMSGKSGLPNFHHIEGKDWDADLAWIDRETAVRRILSQPLLFAPGAGEAHSHSAFVLLAAVIESITKTSYQGFVRGEILKPLGMARTGFYGESLKLDASQFAVGYGASSVGVPNIPPNWGPVSWLVMGSGGMFSTLDDMDRYDAAIASGKLLTGPWAKWQQGQQANAGGSDRGFFIFHVTNGRGTEVLFLMNGEGRAAGARAMTRAMEKLVNS